MAKLAVLFALFASGAYAAAARAQNPADLLPAESAAKAKAILQQAIDALGGPVYLRARNLDCVGRYAAFEKSGDLGGYIELHTYREMPDKERVEYDKDATIVDVYSGKDAWTLDKGGVSALPAEEEADYQEQLKTDINTILRYRLAEDGLFFRYGGTDIVDLKEVDWVEITDRESHNLRVAIDRKTHFPVRVIVQGRDPKTGERSEKGRYFSNYHSIDGIETPYQTSSFVNGRQVSQAFYETCLYNTPLPADLFTRASLDAHWDQVRKKHRK